MGIAERRERDREALRTRIIEAARDIVSAEGLDALSMRAIAERIEYSPGTLYLYFRDKDALLREVVEAGFARMMTYLRDELETVGAEASPVEQYRALGRAYVGFAIENTAYFRVMFELPKVAQMACPAECCGTASEGATRARDFGTEALQRAVDAGIIRLPDARRGAIVGWGLVHGLTSLYLSGQLAGEIDTNGDFADMVEEAMAMLLVGWLPRETPPPTLP